MRRRLPHRQVRVAARFRRRLRAGRFSVHARTQIPPPTNGGSESGGYREGVKIRQSRILAVCWSDVAWTSEVRLTAAQRPWASTTMKTRITLLTAAVCGCLMAATGCGKTESPPAPPASGTNPPSAGTVQKIVDTAQAQTEVVTRKVEDATAAAQAQADAAKAQADAASAKVQGLIDQARTYLGENKTSEALALLNQLSGQKLSTEQQSLVQGLKDQVQKAIEGAAKAKATDEATKAVGGLLPPK